MAGSIWQRNIDVDKDGNATITGNLTVEGTTTTIESTNNIGIVRITTTSALD